MMSPASKTNALAGEGEKPPLLVVADAEEIRLRQGGGEIVELHARLPPAPRLPGTGADGDALFVADRRPIGYGTRR